MAAPERRTRHRLGKRLSEGVQLRGMPTMEAPWIGTFNLRWWQYVDQKRAGVRPRGDQGTAVGVRRS